MQRTEPSTTSLFRRLFKYYKQRNPPPDLTAVIDLRVSDSTVGVRCRRLSLSTNCVEEEELAALGFRPLHEWSLTTLDHRPGLYILNDVIKPEHQLTWLQRCLLAYPEPPNVTNLKVDGTYDASHVFRTHAQRLRWATLGNDYDWTTKEYAERPRSPLPQELHQAARVVSHVLGLGDMDADAAIVNYYPEKASLSPHVDRSERDIDKPLISMSFGQSAVYLTGGTSLDEPVDALMLHSGDVLVMHDSQRLVYHAVPKILKTTRFRDDDVDPRVVDYANNCRVNITIREVD